jgi:hypothetical protein
MTFSTTTLSIMTLSTMAFSTADTQNKLKSA